MWHEAQGTFACPLVSGNPVEVWSKFAVSQPFGVWQFAQLARANAGPALECGGLFVCCQVVKWQPELPQSVGAICKL